MLTPARRRGHEVLDDPSSDPALSVRSLRDVRLSNRLFGGHRAIRAALRPVLAAAPRATGSDAPPCRLLDIGTGLGDGPAAVAGMARRIGLAMCTIGLDVEPRVAREAARATTHAIAGSALALPLADRSVELVTCSLVLHHFDGAQAVQLLRECTRVARTAVVVADLERSWLAIGGLWASSFLLGFHPVSRADGIVSIFRGYTRSELGALVHEATGCHATVRRHAGWRLTATWIPGVAA